MSAPPAAGTAESAAPSRATGPDTGRAARRSHRRRATLALAALLAAAFALTLVMGQSVTPPLDVLRVLAGHDVPGASFTVGQLRLPRAVVAVLAGLCFGLGGAAFQVMLRNPLASPDIIGVSAGASATAVFAIVFLQLGGSSLSLVAIAAGLGVAALIYLLSFRDGVTGTRLILIGIGISAMLHSFIAYALARAPAWSLQEAMRWLGGSVNGVRIEQAGQLLAALIVFGGLVLSRSRDLETMRMGDDMASALGVRVGAVRLAVMLGAVGMIAVATSITGPVAFVAFLAGPIALRIVGPHGSVLVPAALTGALLVLACDFAGQFLLPARYPVGVVTGALGAPFLLWLIIRANRTGGSL